MEYPIWYARIEKKLNPEYHTEIIIHNCNEYYRTTEIFLFTPGSVLNRLLPWNKTFLCIATKTSRATGGLSELSLRPALPPTICSVCLASLASLRLRGSISVRRKVGGDRIFRWAGVTAPVSPNAQRVWKSTGSFSSPNSSLHSAAH